MESQRQTSNLTRETPQLYDGLRINWVFAALGSNTWYRVWQYANESAYYADVSVCRNGRSLSRTCAGHATIKDAEQWCRKMAKEMCNDRDTIDGPVAGDDVHGDGCAEEDVRSQTPHA